MLILFSDVCGHQTNSYIIEILPGIYFVLRSIRVGLGYDTKIL